MPSTSVEVPPTGPDRVVGTTVMITYEVLPSLEVEEPAEEPVTTDVRSPSFSPPEPEPDPVAVGVGNTVTTTVTTTSVISPLLLVRLEVPALSPVTVDGTKVSMMTVLPWGSVETDTPGVGPVTTTSGLKLEALVTTTPVTTPPSSTSVEVPGTLPVTVLGTTVTITCVFPESSTDVEVPGTVPVVKVGTVGTNV